MSKKYRYFANKRQSPLYEGACDIFYCKRTHIYTINCSCCLHRYNRVGRTRRQQQTNDNQKITVPY